jgi:DNA-directed RNA polymerase specialized sigma24 family protein
MDMAMATERVMSAFADSATDEDLLREFCDGSEAAFFELFTRYERRLIAYLFKFTGDMELSKDVCQETFTKLAQRPPRLLFSGRVKPWLFRVGRNLAIDHLRRRKWEVSAGDDGMLADQADAAAAPDETLAGIDDIARSIAMWSASACTATWRSRRSPPFPRFPWAQHCGACAGPWS